MISTAFSLKIFKLIANIHVSNNKTEHKGKIGVKIIYRHIVHLDNTIGANKIHSTKIYQTPFQGDWLGY